jgi:hypothetical protein
LTPNKRSRSRTFFELRFYRVASRGYNREARKRFFFVRLDKPLRIGFDSALITASSRVFPGSRADLRERAKVGPNIMSQQNDFTVSFTASFCLGAPKRIHGFASGMSKFLDGRDWGKAGRAYRIRGGFMDRVHGSAK